MEQNIAPIQSDKDKSTAKKKRYPLIALIYLLIVSVLFIAVVMLTRSDIANEQGSQDK